MIKNNYITIFIGISLVIGTIITFFYKKNKNLIPVKCEVLSFDCIGRGAHVTFLYKNKKSYIGGFSKQLCGGNKETKNIILYYCEKDNTFYFNNDTLFYRYLIFTVIGIIICFIPYFSSKLNNFIFNFDIKKRNPDRSDM